MVGAALHEAEGGDIPEGRGAAVAEHHLVALGQVEELGNAVLEGLHEVLHRGLPVGRAEEFGALRGQRGELLGADLRRSGAEVPIAGKQFSGDLHGSGLSSGA